MQREFFRKVFKRNDASPYEFDLVINMDFIEKPKWAADIVETAFRVKFKDEVSYAVSLSCLTGAHIPVNRL